MLVKKGEIKLEKSLKSMIQAKEQTRKPVVLVCDTSGSMSSLAKKDTKINILARTVNKLLASYQIIRIIQFASSANWVSELSPQANGGTALHCALTLAKQASPQKIIVLSDGEPDSELDAMQAARDLNCPISCIYIGPENGPGFEFLKRLAAANKGSFSSTDLGESSNQLEAKVKKMLPC